MITISKLYTFSRLLIKSINDPYSRFKLAERIFNFIYPHYLIGDYGKYCFEDIDFLEYYQQFEGSTSKNPHNFERMYNLNQLLKLVDNISGDTVDIGVYKGKSSYLILDNIKDSDKSHFMFDSWEGISKPNEYDGNYWKEGDLNSSIDICKNNLMKFKTPKFFLQGWIPEKFKEVNNNKFSFIHIDVDLYEPTKLSLDFFYPKLNPGGIIVFDDYGYNSCPGVKKAVDEFFLQKNEKIISLTTQAFIIKI